MKMFEYLLLIFYLFALFSLLVYGMNCYYLMFCYRLGLPKARERHRRLKEAFSERLPSAGWPRATIQLPIFNERYVAQRLVRAVCHLDYPKKELEIQVLDDSTDDTVKICRDVVQEMREQGFDIVHIHREVRTGFKAGALKEGLERVKGEFIGIFDADFIPCAPKASA